MTKKYKYFIFSDVHGEFDALIRSLEKTGYDEDNPNHKLISLGDNFDRGRENLELYQFLVEHNVLGVKGNHDAMLEDFLYYKDATFDIINNGLFTTIANFAGLFKNTTKNKIARESYHLAYKVNERHPNLKRMLIEMPHGYKIDDYILTHAGFTNPTLIEKHEDKRWFPNNWTNTPSFIKDYNGKTGRFKFIFGHWHAFRLTKEFIGTDDKLSSIFEYSNFIGIDACSNLTYQVNVYVIESNSNPIPFSNRESLEEIKKL